MPQPTYELNNPHPLQMRSRVWEEGKHDQYRRIDRVGMKGYVMPIQ